MHVYVFIFERVCGANWMNTDHRPPLKIISAIPNNKQSHCDMQTKLLFAFIMTPFGFDGSSY